MLLLPFHWLLLSATHLSFTTPKILKVKSEILPRWCLAAELNAAGFCTPVRVDLCDLCSCWLQERFVGSTSCVLPAAVTHGP